MVSRLGITQRQQRGLWYYHGLLTCGQEIFLLIFHKTYRGGQNSIKQHIFRLLEEDHKIKSQAPLTDAKKEKLYKKQFYEKQKQMLEGQTPLEDITLLYKLLRNNRICDLATDDNIWTDESQKLEHWIHFIKDERDKLSHESLELSQQEYTERMENLMRIVKGMLLEAGRQFNEDFSQLSTCLCHKVKAIQETNIIDNLDSSNTEHWQRLKRIQKLRREHEERDAFDGMMREMKKRYEDLCQVQPAPLLLGYSHKAELPEIFVSMELQQDNVMHNMGEDRVIVTHDQLVTVKRPDGTNPTVVIVQGEGGAGKSTLMKMVMYHWLNETEEIEGLSSIPLMLFIECRDSTKESLDDLLQQYSPNTSSFYGPDRLKQIVMSQPLIIIVDGYDEINPASTKLLNEIFGYYGDHIRVFVTTRPINARQLAKIVPETKIKMILQVLGIQENQQPNFVRKLLQVLLDSDEKIQHETHMMMRYMRGLTEDMRSLLHNPLNLSLFVLLWVEKPEKMNSITSMSALYATFRELTTSKVTERLMEKGPTMSEAEDFCQQFLKYFDELAYETHFRGEFELKSETVMELWRKIWDLRLPDEAGEDFLSSYFTTKLSRDQFTLTRIYCFRHRLEQQYSCASHLATLAIQRTPNSTLTELLEQSYSNNQDLESRMDEVMTFLTGILHMKKVLPTFAREIIDLVDMQQRYSLVVMDTLLHHLAECDTDITVLQAAQARLHLYHKEGTRIWVIKSGRYLRSLPPLLALRPVEELSLEIPENPETLTSLYPTIQYALKMNIKIGLYLCYQRDGSQEKDDRSLQIFSGTTLLDGFRGRISVGGVRLLPETLEVLNLEEVDVETLANLATRLHSLHKLNTLMLFVKLRYIPKPDTVTRLQYHGRGLCIHLLPPVTQDDQAGKLGAWLGNIWPPSPPPQGDKLRAWILTIWPETPPPHYCVYIWDTNLTAAGIETLLENFGATYARPDNRKGKKTSSSSTVNATSRDQKKLKVKIPDYRSDQMGPSSSTDAATSGYLEKRVVKLPDDCRGKKRPSSSPDAATGRDVKKLVVKSPDYSSGQAGPSSSADSLTTRKAMTQRVKLSDTLTNQAGLSSSPLASITGRFKNFVIKFPKNRKGEAVLSLSPDAANSRKLVTLDEMKSDPGCSESGDSSRGESSNARGSESGDTNGKESDDTFIGEGEVNSGPVVLGSLSIHTKWVISWKDQRRLGILAKSHGVGELEIHSITSKNDEENESNDEENESNDEGNESPTV
ncbi:uncharacterized protein [Panulirus ornatus]|uniref:uncharacterized protein n=1 Tax=Panulirus ornatus TaxID=150431 RepID=UPI003A84A281